MTEEGRISGLRMFLYGILELIKKGEQENCTWIIANLSNNIASVLYAKYEPMFNPLMLDKENLSELDRFYSAYSGVAGEYGRKYACDESDGLYLIIKLALNVIQ